MGGCVRFQLRTGITTVCRLPSPPRLEGALAPNNVLASAVKFAENMIDGPESMVVVNGQCLRDHNNNNNNHFISKALFHVKHAQLRCAMPMNNTHIHARASKTSDERTIAYKSLKHNTIC